MGLEIYSLRGEAQKDLPSTLALIRKVGFTEVEGGDFYGRSTAEFRRMLDGNGLKLTSLMAAYDRLSRDIKAVAGNAHALGAEYVVCSTVPHKKKLTAEDCGRAIESLNRFGENLAKAGLRCCYHTHGIEFGESPDGTLFDTLAKSTNPKFVNFEMDIFWIVFAYQDPVKLLHKYPSKTSERVQLLAVPRGMYWKKPAFRLARVWSTYLPHCGRRGRLVFATITLRTKRWTRPSRYPRACDIFRAFSFSFVQA